MPNPPAGAKKPSDRLAKEVGSAEHGGTITWRKHKISIKPRREWSWTAASDLRNGLYPEWAQGALTPASFAHVLDERPSLGDFNELLETLMEALGQDMGESERSADSSTSSATSSNTTSDTSSD